MAAPRNRRHIVIPAAPAVEAYTPHKQARGKTPPAFVPASRPLHGAKLRTALDRAVVEARQRREETGFEVHGAQPGTYLQFESQPGEILKVDSLESPAKGIELVAVTHRQSEGPQPRNIQMATVFVPDEREDHFTGRLETYGKTTPKQRRETRHEALFDPVTSLKAATLQNLWTDTSEAWPLEDETIWWEVWLRRHDGDELERLMEFAVLQNIAISDRRIEFTTRIVVLLQANRSQLSAVIDVLNDVAEVQRAKETAAVFTDQQPEEQANWIKDLLDRTIWPDKDAPAVCILDTGITRGHPLFEGAVFASDCTAIDTDWGSHDDGGGPSMMGHGTEMAGLALYGDLTSVLSDTMPVHLRHRLESVKILPPTGDNPPELYGAITAEATSRAEIQNPDRRRCFSMAITSNDERDRGQPTSWSSAIDALAAGRMFDPTTQGLVYLDDEAAAQHRLFVISAGNVDGAMLEIAHLDRSDVEPIQDPAQAWNALTVGAYTSRTLIRDKSWEGWEPLSKAGDLSPWSTTSVGFAKDWPMKPDVVFEGGNVVQNAKGEIDFPCDDLCLLSTHYKPSEKSFVVSWATSAATAQAARMAAIISSDAPAYWPETVRGLIVHSAQWTNEMKAQLKKAGNVKKDRANLVRRYGFGVPHLSRALRSANDSLTLIAQASIRPFSQGAMREMHFYELPWPKAELVRLAGLPVRLRVTLSYFIEPNPGRRGWTKRHRYASHGLRFDLMQTLESPDDFRKRKNRKLLPDGEDKPETDTDDWYLGQARDAGSIHSDFLDCTAADLAERGMIAVFPVSGWWKDHKKRDRSDAGARYSLIVSIETDAADADIWSPVALQVGAPVKVAIEV